LQDLEGRLARLQNLLDKSTFYANALKDIMDAAKARSEHVIVNAPKSKAKKSSAKRKGKKRLRIDSDEEDDEPAKRAKLEEGTKFQQPALITGAKLKDYQLEGVEWMISLDQNGISGILGSLCSPLFCLQF
jgi:ATP-dependent DNA helicase